MKRMMFLLIAGVMFFAFVACDSTGGDFMSRQNLSEPPTAQEPQTFDESQPNGSEGNESEMDVFPKNEIVEAMIEEYENPPYEKPFWASAKPNGIKLYYGDTIVRPPLELSAEEGRSLWFAAYVSKAVTGIAYCVEEGVNPVLILTSGDMGQTWQTDKLYVQNIEKYRYDYPYLAYTDQDNGVLLLSDADNECLLYQSQGAGANWNLVSTFSVPEGSYGLSVTDDAIFIPGRANGYPAILRSENGTDWNSIPLAVDTTAYVSGHCSDVEFRDNVGLAQVAVYDVSGGGFSLYFASDDGGKKWMIYETER
ncbi:MAG: hypothetical protein ACERKO_09585 [Acetanaerobacterium sp.]